MQLRRRCSLTTAPAMLDDLEKHTGHKVRLVFIVVGKRFVLGSASRTKLALNFGLDGRHHIRFFPTHPCVPSLVNLQTCNG